MRSGASAINPSQPPQSGPSGVSTVSGERRLSCVGRPRLGLGGTPRCWPAPRGPPHTPPRIREQKSGAGGGLGPSSSPPQAVVYRFQEERWETQQRTYQEKRRERGHARQGDRGPSVCVVAVGEGAVGPCWELGWLPSISRSLSFPWGLYLKHQVRGCGGVRRAPEQGRTPQAHRTPRPGGLRSPSPRKPPGAPGSACWVPAVSAPPQPPLNLRAASDCPTLWSRVASPPPSSRGRITVSHSRSGWGSAASAGVRGPGPGPHPGPRPPGLGRGPAGALTIALQPGAGQVLG